MCLSVCAQPISVGLINYTVTFSSVSDFIAHWRILITALLRSWYRMRQKEALQGEIELKKRVKKKGERAKKNGKKNEQNTLQTNAFYSSSKYC